ncbi:MAG: DUF4296 domain-containing protein [Bacteroidia bacterium]|nr:DUF4296 domain-containing protein [Bacteroidia bacterium]
MIRFTLLVLILFSLIGSSCSSRKNKLDRSNLIPEKELVSILKDVYISNGLLTLPGIRYWFSSLDSLSLYPQITEKHGYSKETMDKTMKFYYIKKPKKLIKIYDQLLGIISEQESLVEKELLLLQGRISNLWTGKDFYSFPDPSGNDSTQFDISLKGAGIYKLVFSTTLFPDDQSVNPRITAYSCNSDSIDTGKRNYIETINYIKDGQPHIYTLIVNVPDKSNLHLKGRLYDFDNHTDVWEKHVRIENISIAFTPAAAL